jgi:hypothetical protein
VGNTLDAALSHCRRWITGPWNSLQAWPPSVVPFSNAMWLVIHVTVGVIPHGTTAGRRNDSRVVLLPRELPAVAPRLASPAARGE